MLTDCIDEYTATRVFGGIYRHGSDVLLSGGVNTNIHPGIREQLLDVFIPEVGERLDEYGLRWGEYALGPTSNKVGSPISLTGAVTDARSGRNAVGLTQTISFLIELRGLRLANQHFQRRVATGLIVIQSILEKARDDTKKVRLAVENSREDFINSDDEIIVTDSYPRKDKEYNFIDINTGEAVSPKIEFYTSSPTKANLTRARPEGYLIPRPWMEAARKLEVMGVEVEKLDQGFNGTVERMVVTSSELQPSLYEGQALNTVTTETSEKDVTLPPGSYWVSTRQKNAALAFIALEPENVDSFVAFNIVPVSEDEEYPIFRVPRE